MWNDIKNKNDLKKLMNLFGGFHDSCIKEFKYLSGAFVNEKLHMSPLNNLRILKIIFQRQFDEPSVIEIEFIGLIQLKLTPVDENLSCEIYNATMIMTDNSICWYDNIELSEKDLREYEGTIISASRVRWRICDEYIGDKEVYVNRE